MDKEDAIKQVFERWMQARQGPQGATGYEDDDDTFDSDLWDETDWDEQWAEDPGDYEAMAVRLMEVLVENKLDSYILLKDTAIANWWGEVLKYRKKKEEQLRKEEAARRKQEADERARSELLSRLTADEKRLLGIK